MTSKPDQSPIPAHGFIRPILFGLSALTSIFAIMESSVTLANNDYTVVIAIATAGHLLAAGLATLAIIRRPRAKRFTALGAILILANVALLFDVGARITF